MEEFTHTTETAIDANTVLMANFSEDDYIEGVFIIEAKSINTFINRIHKIETTTGFSTGSFDAYEKDEDGGIWKVITTAWFKNVDELKKAMKKMEKYKWFFSSDSSLLLDGEYLYVDGGWLV